MTNFSPRLPAPRFLLLAILALLCQMAAAGEGETKLLACMRSNIPPTVRVQDFELTTTDRTGGTRLLKGRFYAKQENKLLRAMVKLTAPADLNGAAYLVKEGEKSDDMFVFIPALNKTRRIRGGAGDGPLFGTDFSYAEIKQVENALSGVTPKLEGVETIEGHGTKIISVSPEKSANSRYTRMRAWVDDASCIPLRIEFLEGTTPRKRLTAPAASLAKAGNYWYPGEVTMVDLKENTKTKLKITGVKSGEDVPLRYFDERNFYLGG